MSTTAEKTKEFKLTEVFALWKKTSQNGTPYFTGKTKDGVHLTGFFNGKKKNPKEPDLRVYTTDQNDELKEYISMWCKVSKGGNKYLTGNVNGVWFTGFIRKNDNDKAPYVTVYLQEETNGEQVQLTEVETVPF